MVATAQRRRSEGTTERADRPFDPPFATGFAVSAQRPMLHLIRETRRGRRVRSEAEVRAMAVWPRLDPRLLARCQGDAGCLARSIARHRTTLSEEHVLRILATREV